MKHRWFVNHTKMGNSNSTSPDSVRSPRTGNTVTMSSKQGTGKEGGSPRQTVVTRGMVTASHGISTNNDYGTMSDIHWQLHRIYKYWDAGMGWDWSNSSVFPVNAIFILLVNVAYSLSVNHIIIYMPTEHLLLDFSHSLHMICTCTCICRTDKSRFQGLLYRQFCDDN